MSQSREWKPRNPERFFKRMKRCFICCGVGLFIESAWAAKIDDHLGSIVCGIGALAAIGVCYSITKDQERLGL